MNQLKLQDLIKNLEKEMFRIGYKESTVNYYRQQWRQLLKYFEENGIECFGENVGMKFLDEKHNIFEKQSNALLTQSNSYAIRVVRMLGDYQMHRTILRRYHNSLQVIHLPEFNEILSAYDEHCKKCGYSNVTKNHYQKEASKFLAFAESRGIEKVLSLLEIDVCDYVKTLTGYSYKTVELALCALRSFLRFLHLNELHQKDLSLAIPELKSRKQTRIPSVWDRNDVVKLLSVIDRGNPAGKRDYAIILLVTRLGIRTIDVKHLKLENLNWSGNRIEFVQSKTGQAISLPLLKDIGWAIIDYLENGRPKVNYPYVFLRHLAPIEEFADEDRLHQIITKYMKQAKIPISPKKKVGMHSLRHTLASLLLEKETPLAIISDILGHLEPDSTAVYIKTNVEQLRECALKPTEVSK